MATFLGSRLDAICDDVRERPVGVLGDPGLLYPLLSPDFGDSAGAKEKLEVLLFTTSKYYLEITAFWNIIALSCPCRSDQGGFMAA